MSKIIVKSRDMQKIIKSIKSHDVHEKRSLFHFNLPQLLIIVDN